jgi:hypothetical protein
LPDDPTPLIVGYQQKVQTTVGNRKGEIVSNGYNTTANPALCNILTTDQKALLQIVLAQRFLRSYGARLDGHIVLSIVEVHAELCHNHGLFKDAVDLWQICADIFFNKGLAWEAPDQVIRLGEAMEAAKSFRDAAAIYLELADGVFGAFDSKFHSTNRGHAALAFKRAGDYIEAERE